MSDVWLARQKISSKGNKWLDAKAKEWGCSRAFVVRRLLDQKADKDENNKP